jgi:hypothetical protein
LLRKIEDKVSLGFGMLPSKKKEVEAKLKLLFKRIFLGKVILMMFPGRK